MLGRTLDTHPEITVWDEALLPYIKDRRFPQEAFDFCLGGCDGFRLQRSYLASDINLRGCRIINLYRRDKEAQFISWAVADVSGVHETRPPSPVDISHMMMARENTIAEWLADKKRVDEMIKDLPVLELAYEDIHDKWWCIQEFLNVQPQHLEPAMQRLPPIKEYIA